MVTYRKDLARKGWHRPWKVRAVLLLLGLALFVAGGVGWSLEQEYGGDPNRSEYVIGHEPGRAVVYGEEGEVVYESTDIQDVAAYVESQRGGRDFTVPVLLHVGTSLSIILAVAPSPLKRELQPISPTKTAAHI